MSLDAIALLWERVNFVIARFIATYVVTEVHRGIGYEYCRQLQARGDVAIAVCPEVSIELKTLKIQGEEGTSTAAAADLQERLRESPVLEIVTIV